MSTSTIITVPTRIEVVTDLEIAEYDKAGNLKAEYVESGRRKGSARVDVLLPKNSKSLLRRVVDIFLPDGYPQCVTDDYTPYQIYDSLQAFAGSIAGMISSRAVWEGIGVGNSSASPTGALLISVTRECFGRLATITFAHMMGTSIEAECKAYRLISDVFCDVAMILDCMSLSFPIAIRFPMLCLSSTMFAAAGVAGRSSKSSLSAHFAKWNNLGELNATDASQETAISLIGMLVGSVVVYYLPTRTATWLSLLFLLTVHLLMNHAAVRAVKMRSLNRQRANILFSNLVEKGKVLTPKDVSEMESIFEGRGGGVFRWMSGAVMGHCEFGVSVQVLLQCLPQIRRNEGTGSLQLGSVDLSTVMSLFRDQQYILWCQPCTPKWYESPGPKTRVVVVLKQGITPEAQLRAWYNALLLTRRLHDQAQANQSASPEETRLLGSKQKDLLFHAASSLDLANKSFEVYARRLRAAEWELDIPVLETRSGSRISCGKKKGYAEF